MSSKILWANGNIAMLARLHHVRTIRPMWSRHTDGDLCITLEAGERSVSEVVSLADLTAAFDGTEPAQAALVRRFSEMVGALEN